MVQVHNRFGIASAQDEFVLFDKIAQNRPSFFLLFGKIAEKNKHELVRLIINYSK